MALIYELTRRSPGSLREGSLKAMIYGALKDLRRAELDKISAIVMRQDGFRTRQAKPEQQIKWYLWNFEKQGIVRRRPERRWRG